MGSETAVLGDGSAIARQCATWPAVGEDIGTAGGEDIGSAGDTLSGQLHCWLRSPKYKLPPASGIDLFSLPSTRMVKSSLKNEISFLIGNGTDFCIS